MFIRILSVAVLLCLVCAPGWAESEEGFVPLFDGENLEGWDGDPRFWSVRDGAITGQATEDNPTEKNTFIIWRQGEVDDFVLRLSYRIIDGNSGIQYRSKEFGPWVIGGYQADFEAGTTYSGINYEEKGRGILAKRGERTRIKPDGEIEVLETFADGAGLQDKIKDEDWNHYEISAIGNRLIHTINGQVMSDVTDDQPEKGAMAGLLALQLHAGPPMVAQFKDIRIKRLPRKEGKKIVLVAGRASHAMGEHEFPAGVHAIKSCLDKVPGVVAADYYGGWPADPSAFDNADSILFYMDGGSGHPVIQGKRRQQLDALLSKGVGMVCVHYAVEVPKDKGGKEFKKWIGGYYETHYSINPHWVADITVNENHPTTCGITPFTLKDEWYYNMRFRPEMKDVDPILTATPPDETRRTKATEENPGREEILAWATEREDGGRGFGLTGGHYHFAWADANFRKLTLNALLWTAGMDVPEGGVDSDPSDEELNGRLRSRLAEKK